MNETTYEEVFEIEYRDLGYDIRPAIRAYHEFAKSNLNKNELKILDSILAIKPYNSASPVERDDLYNRWVEKKNDELYGRLKTDRAKVEYSLLNALCKELQHIEVTYKAGNPEPAPVSPTPFQTYYFNIRQEKDRMRKQAVLAALKKTIPGSIISLTYSLQCRNLNGGTFELLLDGKVFWKTNIASYSLSGNIPLNQAIKPGKNHVQLRIHPPQNAKTPSFSGEAELLLASEQETIETTGGNSGSFAEFVFNPTMMPRKQDSYYEAETTFEYGIGKR